MEKDNVKVKKSGKGLKIATIVLGIVCVLSLVLNFCLNTWFYEIYSERRVNAQLYTFKKYIKETLDFAYEDCIENVDLYSKDEIYIALDFDSYYIEMYKQERDTMDLSYSISETEESDDVFEVYDYVVYDPIKDEYYVEITSRDSSTEMFIRYYDGDNGIRDCVGNICEKAINNENINIKLNDYVKNVLERNNFKKILTDSGVNFKRIF